MSTDTVRERRLALEGGCNFRDLGGYAGRHGVTRWGMVYRAGTPAKLTAADVQRLLAAGVRAACDFRSAIERERHRSPWADAPGVVYWCGEDSRPAADERLQQALAHAAASPDAGQAFMAALYRTLPRSHAGGYGAMFTRLAAGDVPLVFNCSAGKDRAGVGAALLLEALGVERETIVADYLLTNDAQDLHRAREALADDEQTSMSSKLPPAVLAAMWRAEPAYIAAMFEALDAEFCSIEGYLEKALAIDAEALAAIRGRLLEPA